MQTDEQILLSEYKKYDYLNSDSKNPLIKIFVSYIKPSFLFKSEILTPIHLGRAIAKENSKDGIISDNDLEWLYKNCIGDDNFEENISSVNRRVGFLTGTWWAYKNYKKLGNPEYFGSYGYRRLLNPEFLKDLQNYDCILPYKNDFPENKLTIGEHFKKLHGEKIVSKTCEIIQKIHPKDTEYFNRYLNENSGYFYELYVYKKELFFDFCEWIFPILFEFLKIPQRKLEFDNHNLIQTKYMKQMGEIRDAAYAIERISGFYCYKLANNKKLRCKHENIIHIKNEETIRKSNSTIIKLLRNHLADKTKS